MVMESWRDDFVSQKFLWLDHELGDVGEQSTLAEINFLERDGREESMIEVVSDI